MKEYEKTKKEVEEKEYNITLKVNLRRRKI
jgi:hypothetical protein